MLLFFIIAALAIAILAVIFAIQNVHIIIVSFLAWKIEGSLALVLLLTFTLGFMTGLLIILPKLLKKKSGGAQREAEEKTEEKKVEEF